MIIRDQGCAWPGRDRPPSWCDGHHIQYWEHGGPTSLDNCVLLCKAHHRLQHDSEWIIQIRDGLPGFIPPAWIDPRTGPAPKPGHPPAARGMSCPVSSRRRLILVDDALEGAV
ncbi:HNH endonuclease signature motif containing protein, partial [Pseudonocardia sp. GCM10023141]|uniref:HNH endonuclease signature motif containing protein n=1 Tax=Pseudonocardia sp. GCM10023141 TaxID=3252653 RepID=UPI00360A17E2